MGRQLFSVIVPAYNQPDRLQQCVNSIARQSYRPIEIIVSDDQSPNSLEHVVSMLAKEHADDLVIHYIKPPENYKPYWNINYGFLHAQGRYCCLMPHDDWLVDNFFFEEAIFLMSKHAECFVSMANTCLEGSNVHMLKNIKNSWLIVDGQQFVASCLFDDWHPAYSGVVFDLAKLRQTEYFEMTVSRADCKKINFDPDEGFLSIAILATEGVVAINGKTVSVRGWLPDSYSKSEYWLANWSRGLFVVYYKLCSYYMRKGYLSCARRVRGLLLEYSLPYYDSEIAAYLGSSYAHSLMILNLARAGRF